MTDGCVHLLHNSSSHLGSSCQGNRYGTEKADGTACLSCVSRSLLYNTVHNTPAKQLMRATVVRDILYIFHTQRSFQPSKTLSLVMPFCRTSYLSSTVHVHNHMYMVHVYYFTANGVLPFLLHEMFKVLRICAFSNYYIRVGTSAAIWNHLVTDTRTY
jgi:hypothetical protein